MRALVLASTSRWRRKLLEDAGVAATGVAPGVDERALEAEVPPGGDRPARVALHLARAKAAVVAAGSPDAWVLAADQVVHQDGEVFGKPDDPGDHLRRLRAMRGRVHELVTGWVLWTPDAAGQEGVCVTRMHVRADLDEDELIAYVASGEGSGCAGGYAVEGRGAFLFERIEGDWFNVIGLPLLDVMTALRQRGWRST